MHPPAAGHRGLTGAQPKALGTLRKNRAGFSGPSLINRPDRHWNRRESPAQWMRYAGMRLRWQGRGRGGSLDVSNLGTGELGADLLGPSRAPNDENGAIKKWELPEDAGLNGEVLRVEGGDGEVVVEDKGLPEGYVEDDCWIPHRWRVTFLIALAFVLCNMDKVNMSVAVIPMAQELGWSATSRGIVQSSFFFGYTATQIPAGWISTKIGGAIVLLCGVAVWSLGTLVAPMAAHSGFLLLCMSRVVVGLGEGFAPSAATAVLAKQVPENERARAVATVFGSLDLGSAVGLLICGPLIRMYGWPCVFYFFAILGLVWCGAWPFFKPEKTDAIMWKKKLVDVSRSPNGTKKAAQDEEEAEVPWGEFFKSAPVWAVITAHFCFNWGYYTLLSWLPSFFELALKLDVQNSSFLTVIPYVAMTFMTPMVGPAADILVQNGVGVTTVRKVFQGISFAGSAVCMLACGLLTPQNTAGLSPTSIGVLVALLSVCFAVGACSRAGLYCNHQDLSPRFSSALLGISNTAGAIPGILGVWSAGYLLDLTGSWSLSLFYPIAATQVFGLLIYTIFGSSKKQSWS